MTFKNSAFLRWVYYFNDGRVPARTSLCKLFWRTIFAVTIQPIIVGIVILGSVLAGLAALLAKKVVDWLDSKTEVNCHPTGMPRGKGRRARRELSSWLVRLYYNNFERFANLYGVDSDYSDVYNQLIATGEYTSRWDRIVESVGNFLERVGNWQIWTILYNGVVAIKQRVCPLVTIERAGK